MICFGTKESLEELTKLEEDPFPQDVADAILKLTEVVVSKGDLSMVEFTALFCVSLLDVASYEHFMKLAQQAKAKTLANTISYLTMNGLEL